LIEEDGGCLMDVKFFEIYQKNKGALNGAFIGLISAIFLLKMGILQTLFIALCVGVGYYIGDRLSRDKNYITALLDRILPPGTYR
jgi:uncharacterized membrane protein